jgi:hypothetical protein
MANWAIVVGVDQYWHPDFNLESCVKDAYKVSQWLLTSETCKVLPQNLFLLTRPTPPPPELYLLPDGVSMSDATFTSLVDATSNLMAGSEGKGEKFFFYFSGHGLTNESSINAEEAIVMADFNEVHTDNALEIRSFIEYFKSTRFNEQFFIVDACRNVLDWGRKFHTRQFTSVGDIDPNLPAVQQYTLLATSPRTSAVAIGDTSAFTEELLKGLTGKPMTVALDTNTGEYVVTTSRLFSFVEKQILDRKINVSDDENNPIFQAPRINGEHGSHDPELARLNAEEVEKINLRVFVDPDLAWAQAEVTILDQFGDEKWKIKPITKTPENRALEPMFYTARAYAPGYKSSQAKYPINLYTDLDVPVVLIPEPPTEKTIDWPMSPSESRDSKPTKITISASDSLALLELVDSMGTVVETGQGTISQVDMDPGFYRARLVTPEGQFVEKLVSLADNEQEKVVFDSSDLPSSPLVAELGEPQFAHNDEAADFAKKVGLMAAPQLCTVLAVAGSEVNQDQSSNRYRDLGIRSFKETVPPGVMSGVQILSGSEGVERNTSRLSSMKVGLWRIGQAETGPAGQLMPTGPLGFYEFSQAAEPGPYFLSVGVAEEEPAVFAISILPNRLTMLVLQYDASGSLRVFQYNLALTSENEKYKKLSPDQVRRLELAQRFYLSGRLDYALETGVKLLFDKWADPLAGCLGGYLLLRLGKPHELSVATKNMVAFYGELCDSHVLKGEYEAHLGNEEVASMAYKRALDLGVPVFADGLTRLAAVVQKYQFQDHPNAQWISKVDSKRVRGYLWTAWRPSKETRTATTVNTITNVGGDLFLGKKMTAGGNIYNAERELNIANRDVVNVKGSYYQSPQPTESESSLPAIFSQLVELSRSLPDADVEVVEGVVDKLRETAMRIQQGDESADARRVFANRLKSLINIQRAVGELALERLSNPEAQVASSIRRIAREVQAALLDA